MNKKLQHNVAMSSLKMITFRCPEDLFRRLEHFAVAKSIDRTSALKLAIHYYLNRRAINQATGYTGHVAR